MSQVNKILVIGAGIAGPSVCYWLKRYGFSPSMIEISPNMRKGGYAIDIRGIAVDVAKKMGIYDEVCEKRTSLASGRYVDANGETIYEEPGEKFGFRQGDEVEIDRGELATILMDLVNDIPCRYQVSIERIDSLADRVEVVFSDGGKETYDLVIAADGLHSATRRMVFGEQAFQYFNLDAYISVFSIPNYLKLDHSEILFEHEQKLVHVTSDKNPQHAYAGFMFRSQYQLNNVRDEVEQRQFLKETFSDLGWETNTILELMDKSDDLYFDLISQIKMDKWHQGRVVLLGDAGYCASPLSGQGTSLALVGAYILAGELKRFADDYEQALNRYHGLLRPFVDANQAFGAEVSKTFLHQEAISKELAKERTDTILEKMAAVTHAIDLPVYD